MKKNLYMIMAAAALMAVGCEKNIETTPEGDNAQECSLTVSLSTDTKITFDGNENFKSAWEVGDQIKVQTGPDSYSIYTLFSGAGEKKAVFQGDGTPMNGGKVLYPAAKWNSTTYVFASEYTWDDNASTTNSFKSIVPMAGTIKGTTANFDYVSGAIYLEYSKIPLTSAKLTLSFGGQKPTGAISLNGESLNASPTSTQNPTTTITIWMRSDHKQLGGTTSNAKFLIPVPVGSYNAFSIAIYKEDEETVIGGSSYSMRAGKTLSVANKELKKLPYIDAVFPRYTFTPVTSGIPDDGTYILVYDKKDGTGWVNGDDDKRETLPCEVVTLDHLLYPDIVQGTKGVILDLADYETAAWKVIVPEDWNGDTTREWKIQTNNKGIFRAYFVGFTDEGYVQLFVKMSDSTINNNQHYNNIKYYTNQELLQINRTKYSQPIWANGGFLIRQNQWGGYIEVETNIKLYKYLCETPEPQSQG